MLRMIGVLLLIAGVATGCDRNGKATHSGSANSPGVNQPERSAADATAPPAAPGHTRPATTRPAAAAPPATAHTPAKPDGPPDALVGTWVAEDVDAKIGQVKINLTFREEGRVKIIAWSELPLVGKVREKKAPYEVHGDTISSDAIRGGTTVKYWFDGDQLVIEYKDGKTVRFRRA